MYSWSNSTALRRAFLSTRGRIPFSSYAPPKKYTKERASNSGSILADREEEYIRLNSLLFLERVQSNHKPGFELENVPVRRENRN